MLSRDEDILKAAEEWRKNGREVALATVVETWGSAPRPVGSNLVIDNEGNFLGSVSGGCVEGAVVAEAMDVIESGKRKCSNSVSPMKRPGRSACPAAAPSAFTWRK
jgi:xanthine/CO dehydrogenase XdhC/CoxF family maturation factor